MHFSALAILACALVASAAPAPAPGHDNSIISVVAPVTVEYALNGNTIKAGNDVLNGHGKRSLINIFAPVTISNILNCNDIEIANNILNGLAAELGCLVADLLITVLDIIDCHDSSRAHELLSQAAANASKVQKRHGDDALINVFAPVTVEYALNGNTVKVGNDVLNGHGKRGLINIFAPINISNILNCNNIEIANNILNGLALELGCLVAELLITVEDIIGCHDEASAHHLLSEAAANASKVQKRHDDGLINIFAPINISNILNCNNIEVANHILDGLAAELGCLVAELLITVQDIIGCHDESSAHKLLSEAAANASKVQKRHDDGLINIYAPINISNILNCNTIEIANDILNGLAAELGCLVAELLITVQDILGCHDASSAHHLLSEAAANASKVQKRHDDGLINIYAPITISNILNCNNIEIANNILNGLAAELGCLVAELLITVEDIIGCHDEARAHHLLSEAAANASKVQKRHDDSLINIFAPINISNILNCNNIEVANHILDGLALELGCLVAELLITVEDIIGCHDEHSAHELLSKAADNVSHKDVL
ncbi:hypothetical protein FIBSPDRAFT_1039480 [Athelia psychrophila]|uniref:Uncharacterized protein n=1 Tax=Athelia psychrophila TaxID=1759441 RepID=A0A166RX28_9AGAM|nr:hypothetical protein FIBSPDRAFT_1039480 [Fibularhizoctonia sp. CBS 109695]